MTEELTVAITVAREAGAILLKHYGRPTAAAWKGPGSPVTAADHEASDFLTGAINRRFPRDCIVSEETASAEAPARGGRVWMIDPMDGTSEFIQHRDEFSVMIGLLVEQQPMLGVIYQPTSGTLYYAELGSGALREEGGTVTPLRVSAETEPSRMTVARSRSHPAAGVDEACRRIGITRAIDAGSIGLKIGMICEGRAHLYLHVEQGLWQWDTCAPQTLLTEAGGKMTDLSGAALRYGAELRHTNGIVASNGVIHGRIVEALAHVQGAAGR